MIEKTFNDCCRTVVKSNVEVSFMVVSPAKDKDISS
jgi:hypothetical protein